MLYRQWLCHCPWFPLSAEKSLPSWTLGQTAPWMLTSPGTPGFLYHRGRWYLPDISSLHPGTYSWMAQMESWAAWWSKAKGVCSSVLGSLLPRDSTAHLGYTHTRCSHFKATQQHAPRMNLGGLQKSLYHYPYKMGPAILIKIMFWLCLPASFFGF